MAADLPTDLDPATLIASVAADLVEVEALRRRALGASLAAVAALGGVLAVLWKLTNPVVVGFAGVIAVFVFFSAVGHLLADFGSAYKRAVVGQMLGRLDPSLRYEPEAGVGRDALLASMRDAERLASYFHEDLIEGEVDGRARRVSQMIVMLGKPKHSVAFLRGLFAEAARATPLPGHVVIAPADAGAADTMAHRFAATHRPHGVEVPMADVAFAKAFVVFASDEALARRVVGPELQAGLLALKPRVKGSIGVTITGDRAYVLVHHEGDLLEPSFFRPATDPTPVAGIADHLRFALAVMAVAGLAAQDEGPGPG